MRDAAQGVHGRLALAVGAVQLGGRDDRKQGRSRTCPEHRAGADATEAGNRRAEVRSAAPVRRVRPRAGTRARPARGGGPRPSACRSSLEKIEVTCFSTARSVTTSASAIALFERPSAISPSTSRSRGVSDCSGILAAPAAEQQRDDLRIERRAAAGDAPHGVGERVHVGDAVLEQVAGALGRAATAGRARRPPRRTGRARARRSPGCSARMACAARRPSSVWRRRHADVDHGDVGLVGADLAQQVLGVARLAGDLEARTPPAAARAPRAAARSRRRSRRGWARSYGDLSTKQGARAMRGAQFSLPSSAATRSASPRSPDPRPGSAPPTPSSATSTTAWPLVRATLTRACEALAYLATLVSASATTK